jgi:hypothetical protein
VLSQTDGADVASTPKVIGGWSTEWGDVLTTKTLQQEAGIGADYGPESDRMSLGENSLYISQYLVYGHVTALFALSQPFMAPSLDEKDRIDNVASPVQGLAALDAWLMANPGAQAARIDAQDIG